MDISREQFVRAMVISVAAGEFARIRLVEFEKFKRGEPRLSREEIVDQLTQFAEDQKREIEERLTSSDKSA